jgi:MGT family glycosyltransferase
LSRLIVAATPFQGHAGPLLTIAEDLVARDHEVIFFTGQRFSEQVRATGCSFEPVALEADFDDRHIHLAFPQFAEVRVGPPMHEFFWRIFIDAVPVQHRQLLELIATFKPDAIIHDAVFLGALPFVLDPAASNDRPEVIGIGVLPPVLLSDDTPPFGPGTSYVAGEEGRALNRELNAAALREYTNLQEHAEKVFRSVGVALPDFVFTSAVTVPDHFLQLTVPGFEYPRPSAPPSFQIIGALPQMVHEFVELPHWWPRLRDRPVVMVTQGTLANEDLSDLILPTVRALAGEDVTVVAVTARADGPQELAGLLGTVPENAYLAGYVPFDKLLPHVAVMVTNGGYGGVNTAVRNGVPVVVAGDSEDKPEVAARVEWSGTGIDLRTGIPEPDAISRAVTTVLDDPGYRDRARALGEEYAKHDALATLADIIARIG